jgi:hypothetical protein
VMFTSENTLEIVTRWRGFPNALSVLDRIK